MKLRLLAALCLCPGFGALPMLAQLPAPNAAGVSAGHDIMIVKDLDGATKFWRKSVLNGQWMVFAGQDITEDEETDEDDDDDQDGEEVNENIGALTV